MLCLITLFVYLIIGLTLSLIYDYHSPVKRNLIQHIISAVFWPLILITNP